jgi:putative solute:sodium symporter small subunit
MNSRSQTRPSTTGNLIQVYWRRNVRIMASLIAVWAVVGLGAGVLFADFLNAYTLPGTGFPLGFWFAHQGSIISFVILILVYCLLMNRLDDRHHQELQKNLDGDAG